MAIYGQTMYLGNTLIDTTFLGNKQALTYFADRTKPYITSGSVLVLNAGDTASYPGTGTTWYDVSGYGNNAILTTDLAGTWTGGGGAYFDFPRQTTYTGSIASQTDLNNAFAADFTIDMWITVDSIQAGAGDWVCPFGKNSLASMSTLINRDTNTNNRGQNRIYYANAGYEPGTKLNIVAGAWFNWQITRNGSTLTFYENTTSLGTTTLSGNLSNSNNLILGLGFNGTNYPMDGKMGWFAIYNRALSTGELAVNYNYIRTRYGL